MAQLECAEPDQVDDRLFQCDSSAIKLLSYVIRNTLHHAATVNKYHRIRVEKLSQKLADRDLVMVIELLSRHGFEQRNQGSILKFNPAKIQKLRTLQSCIEHLTIFEVNEINEADAEEVDHADDVKEEQEPDSSFTAKQRRMNRNKSRQRTFNCICGNALMHCTPAIYGKDAVILCDECFHVLEPNESMFHCSRGNTEAVHVYGYDLCEQCGITKRRQQHLQQQAVREQQPAQKTDTAQIDDEHVAKDVDIVDTNEQHREKLDEANQDQDALLIALQKINSALI